MDPNLFHVDWERLFEVLVSIVVLSFLVERALAVIFESRLYIDAVEKWKAKGLKEFIALVVGIVICVIWDFDAISMIFLKEKVTWFGAAVTGAVVAGGSKASIKLFKEMLGFMSDAEKLRQIEKESQREKAKSEGKPKGGTGQ
jgi:hypothetical protein